MAPSSVGKKIVVSLCEVFAEEAGAIEAIALITASMMVVETT